MNIVPYHPFDIFLQNGQKFILSGWILEKLWVRTEKIQYITF
jgi:hypothetical protein